MILDFQGLLDGLEDDEIFAIANGARPGTNYLYNAVLPEELKRGYRAKAGSMTIRATMAKLVGMDSPYPRTGAIETSDFEHEIAKMAVEMPFPEQYRRELREMVQEATGRQMDSTEEILETMFNFVDKLLVQPHLDTAEWLRSQALWTGQIDWQSDDIHLEVDYGIPAENFLAARTGNDAYHGSTSKFWDDVRLIRTRLKNQVRAIFAHPDTIEAIQNNPANNLKLISQDEMSGIYTFRKYILVGGVPMVSEDVRDNVKLIAYSDEGEVFDDTQPGSGVTKKVSFCPTGGLLAIGAYDAKRFRVGTGSTQPQSPVELGYTHVGPTEEGDGKLGRWANLYVPEGKKYQFIGQSVTNLLPVIEAPDRICVSSTEMPS